MKTVQEQSYIGVRLLVAAFGAIPLNSSLYENVVKCSTNRAAFTVQRELCRMPWNTTGKSLRGVSSRTLRIKDDHANHARGRNKHSSGAFCIGTTSGVSVYRDNRR